jgi:PIN domain nuclease of toxin-antitoxin system
VNFLLDTHIFIWSLFSPGKISKNVKLILTDPEKTKYISVITFWEISLKYSLGKIKLIGVMPENLPDVAKESGYEILNLEAEVASSVDKLPRIKNKDPFDRIIARQAMCSDFTLLTQDRDFADYKNQGLKMIR